MPTSSNNNNNIETRIQNTINSMSPSEVKQRFQNELNASIGNVERLTQLHNYIEAEWVKGNSLQLPQPSSPPATTPSQAPTPRFRKAIKDDVEEENYSDMADLPQELYNTDEESEETKLEQLAKQEREIAQRRKQKELDIQTNKLKKRKSNEQKDEQKYKGWNKDFHSMEKIISDNRLDVDEIQFGFIASSNYIPIQNPTFEGVKKIKDQEDVLVAGIKKYQDNLTTALTALKRNLPLLFTIRAHRKRTQETLNLQENHKKQRCDIRRAQYEDSIEEKVLQKVQFGHMNLKQAQRFYATD
jgi:hypothetical protein